MLFATPRHLKLCVPLTGKTLCEVIAEVVTGIAVTDGTTTLVIRSTQKNAGTTVTAINALANGVAQQTGFASASGTVTLSGNNSGFAGQLVFEPGANLRVLGVSALNNKSFTMAGGTLQLLDNGDGTGGPQDLAFNHAITVSGNVILTVGPSSVAALPNFNPPANKRAQISTLNVGNNVVTVQLNQNGNVYDMSWSPVPSGVRVISPQTREELCQILNDSGSLLKSTNSRLMFLSMK